MPKVDFYILDRDAPDARLTVACRIAEKAMNGRLNIFVLAADQTEADRLDDLMWTFSQGSFVPHRVIRAGAGTAGSAEPVLIGIDEPDSSRFDLLINLAQSMPAHVERYERIVELVDADQNRRTLGRERYKNYRERGCSLESHHV